MCGPIQSYLIQHYVLIGGLFAYFGLTCINQLPDKWEGTYPYFRDVCRSLAASKMAQRLEAKYSVTTPDGTNRTQTVSSSSPATEAPKL